MLNLVYLEDDIAGANVKELISRISEPLFVAVGRATLYKDVQFVQAPLQVGATADMTRRRFHLAFTIAFRAGALLLHHHSGHNLPLDHREALAVALIARVDVRRVIGAGAAAVRADRLPSVLDFHVLAIVEVFKCQLQLHRHGRAGPLRLGPAAATTEEHVKRTAELRLVRLVGTLLAAAIVFTALVVVAKYVVSSRDVFVFLSSILVSRILVRMVLETLLSERSLDLFLVSASLNVQNLVEVSFLLRLN